MAWESQLFNIPGATTAVDMSGLNGGSTNGYQSSAQFLFAKLTGANLYAPCAALTDFPVGVIQTNPKAGTGSLGALGTSGVEIRSLGVTKLVSGAALAAGALVGPSATGQAVARVVAAAGGDATHWVAGVVLEATSAQGELATVLLLSPFYLQS